MSEETRVEIAAAAYCRHFKFPEGERLHPLHEARPMLQAIVSALDEGRTDPWQPIATAPNHWVLVWARASHNDEDSGEVFVASRHPLGAWEDAYGEDLVPTHWMPLPAPPEAP